MDKSVSPLVMVSVGLVAAALLYVSIKGAKSTGAAIGAGAVDLVDGVIRGSITGIGGLVGVPPTEPDKCAKCKANGDTWCASFACSAADFLEWLWNR